MPKPQETALSFSPVATTFKEAFVNQKERKNCLLKYKNI